MKSYLPETHPELAKQWHYTKNGSLTPWQVTKGSNKKVWWQCPKGNDHEWEATIYSRTGGGNGCPCCSGRKVVPSNCFAATYPELSKQWHKIKNGDLTPDKVVAGSHQIVWWQCSKANDHEWEASVGERTRTDGKASGCPCCDGKKAVLSNCFTTTHPEIAKQWHKTKNGKLRPNDFTAGSHQIVWWQCPKSSDHEWKAPIKSRTITGNGCPCCDGKKALSSNCLPATHPDLDNQWHKTKNGKLSPDDFKAGSNKVVWWQCPKDHEWKAVIASRANGCGCPRCNESKGEREIARILMIRGLKYKCQASFARCRHKRNLPFDFLVKVHEKIGFCIEFNGEQHYKPVRRSRAQTLDECEIELRALQHRDRIKEEYCKSNNIPLLVVPYWEKDIEGKIEEMIDLISK